MEETEPHGTDEKVTKWPPWGHQIMQKDATHAQSACISKPGPRPGENQVMKQPTPPRAHASVEISTETRWIAHVPWKFQSQGIKAASDLALDSFSAKILPQTHRLCHSLDPLAFASLLSSQLWFHFPTGRWVSRAELSPIEKHRWPIHLSTVIGARHCGVKYPIVLSRTADDRIKPSSDWAIRPPLSIHIWIITVIYIGLPPRDIPLDYSPTPPDILVIDLKQVIFGYHCVRIGYSSTLPTTQ